MSATSSKGRSLVDRVTRLEAALVPVADLPVVLDECEWYANRVEARTIVRNDGASWEQQPSESIDAFRDRVKTEAAREFRPGRGDTMIRLAMLRPRISREEWLATLPPLGCC